MVMPFVFMPNISDIRMAPGIRRVSERYINGHTRVGSDAALI